MRLTSLDVFRGITIAAMILVNMAGVADDIYPLLDHANWNGCTPTDLVFPFLSVHCWCGDDFLAVKIHRRQQTHQSCLLRILRRAAILFALGLLLNGFWNKVFGLLT